MQYPWCYLNLCRTPVPGLEAGLMIFISSHFINMYSVTVLHFDVEHCVLYWSWYEGKGVSKMRTLKKRWFKELQVHEAGVIE